MKIIVCLDDRNGMLFGGRRQSKDSLLRTRVLDMAAEGILWMNGYSAGQFEEADCIRCDEAFLEKAGTEDYCFVENADITPYWDRIDGVIVYRWNRHYPADVTFSIPEHWRLAGTEEFPGSSHELITEERYML